MKEKSSLNSPLRRSTPLVILIVLLLITLASCTGSGSSVLTEELSEPLSSVKTAKVEIDPGDGNLSVDHLISSEQELASGTLQYLENQGQPTRAVNTSSDPATFTLKAQSGQPWVRLPWAACNGATDWQIHLNPQATTDLTAHTDGGNVKLNLAGMAITHLLADTGGGNIEVTLPDTTANMNATVKTGAGNVTVAIGSGFTGSSSISATSGAGNVIVRLPESLAARIHTSNGMGKTIVDARFAKVGDSTYQTPDYGAATNRVEITVSSGAGNVIIATDQSMGSVPSNQ